MYEIPCGVKNTLHEDIKILDLGYFCSQADKIPEPFGFVADHCAIPLNTWEYYNKYRNSVKVLSSGCLI